MVSGLGLLRVNRERKAEPMPQSATVSRYRREGTVIAEVKEEKTREVGAGFKVRVLPY